MRITNKMMTNNMLYNINRNKQRLSILEEQYASGKKIQRPSDDPIVAIRTLKLRTSLAELKQYHEKNIPDAMSWMNVSEGALDTVNDLFTPLHTYLVQGANDPLTKADRDNIVANLKELAEQIYHEGNTDYAGRYVFTGYKTDTSLLFGSAVDNLDYTITENFKGMDIEAITKVKEDVNFEDYDLANLNPEEIASSPELINTYRIQLSYKELMNATSDGSDVLSLEYDLPAGETKPNIVTVSSADDNAYQPGADEIHFIPETGELILGETAYKQMQKASDISVTYKKDSFKADDLRPEHYFNCKVVDKDDPDQNEINYIQKDQQIQYEVNFNQKLTINTQAKDAFTHDIKRCVDDIINVIEDVNKTENKIEQVEKALKDPSIEDKEGLERLLENLNNELSLKNKVLQNVFGNSMTTTSKQQDKVNVAVADLGSRVVRLQLTESRLANQKVDFQELLLNNEGVNLVDTIIEFGSAETLYNASLSAASQIVRNTLLNFL